MRNSTYIMFPNEHFAIVAFAPGQVGLQEMLTLNNRYKNDVHYPDIHYLVIYAKSCTPDTFDFNNLKLLSEQYSVEPLPNNHIRTVIVIDEPEATAFSHMFLSLADNRGEYCLTLEKAFQILKMPISIERYFEMVNQVLSELES